MRPTTGTGRLVAVAAASCVVAIALSTRLAVPVSTRPAVRVSGEPTVRVWSVDTLVRAQKSPVPQPSAAKWVAGDMHTHSVSSDGVHPERQVLEIALTKYRLDWVANSDHGGTSSHYPSGGPLPSTIPRWLSIERLQYPVVRALRRSLPRKLVIQAVEWTVPGHEHASVGIVGDEPDAIAQFEYRFDAHDPSTSVRDWGPKANKTAADALTALRWLQAKHPLDSYCVINHPDRLLAYSIADLRDMNDAAPSVTIGFEGIPGHQANPARGEYYLEPGSARLERKARTYGGADSMLARVGGVWDAMIAEGRRYFVFANSDFHTEEFDFWPGQYAKNVTLVQGGSYRDLVAGLRSGDSFAVTGDLVDRVQTTVVDGRDVLGTMGSKVHVRAGDRADLIVTFHSPAKNNNGARPKVDHIDVISGEVHVPARAGTARYRSEVEPTTRVIARIYPSRLALRANGSYVATVPIGDVGSGRYFRLRGTNLAVGTKNEVDGRGDPIIDTAVGRNRASRAWADLWFYTNPVWVLPEPAFGPLVRRLR